MTAYTITPVGRHGVDKTRAQVVFKPPLRDEMARHELSRRLVAAVQELEVLKRQLPVAQAAARHMERLRLRLDSEVALRTAMQERLDRVAAVLAVVEGILAVIEGTCPSAREAVEAARDEIWGLGDV